MVTNQTIKHNRKVVISGIGIFSPFGEGIDVFLNNIINNKTEIKLKSDWSDPEIGEIFAAISENIPFQKYFTNIKLPYPQKYSQLGMIGCYLALQDAGIKFPIESKNERIGLIINTTMGANEAVESYITKLYNEGPAKVSPFLFTQ